MPTVIPRPIVFLKGEYRPLVIVQLCSSAIERAGFSEEAVERFEGEIRDQWHVREIIAVCFRYCDIRE